MPRRSFERIALTRLLVGGCAVFGACALVQQAQAEHNGGGGVYRFTLRPVVPMRCPIRDTNPTCTLHTCSACTRPAI
jgi:hypothetical protein